MKKSKKTEKNIEVELRTLLDEKRFVDLNNFLLKNGEDLGEDNKDTHFFILPEKLIKVTDNISKNNAKITLKLQKIGVGSDFEEIEVFFVREHSDKAVRIFNELGFKNYMYSYQSRHNYLYKGIEFALKYTESWGFHCEMEIMVNSKKEVDKTMKNMKKVAKELGINIMEDTELKKFTAKLESGWNRGEYSKEEYEGRLN
jgi:predicted adenylyl cyclase CyaB